jgi:hypothetical protein
LVLASSLRERFVRLQRFLEAASLEVLEVMVGVRNDPLFGPLVM